MKSVQQQCAAVHTIQSDLNRLLSSTYNGAVALAEHPEYEGRLRSFLSTYETALIKCYSDLAGVSRQLIDVWSSDALRAAPNLEPAPLLAVDTVWLLPEFQNDNGSHTSTGDPKVQQE